MDIIISGCEKDTNQYKELANYDKSLNVVGITHTNDETIQQFLEKNPDLLLLDTTSDNINILYILKKLTKYNTEICKKVILIIDDDPYPIVDHSQFLDIVQKPITQDIFMKSIYKIYTKQPNKITIQDVKKLLLNLKIDLYSNGVHYLIEAIILAAENHRLLQNVQEIYEKIGIKHNISYDKVKWSIRSTVDTINRYADKNLLASIFRYYDETRALTPKYFIKLALYSFDIDADE